TTTVDAIGGVDGSDIVINAGVNLIIADGSQFIFNNGKSITITASGASITNTGTGSFGNGILYYTDVDGDNYATSSTLKTSSSNAVRAKDALGITDCDDSNSTAWVYRYTDADGDGFTGSTAACVGTHPATDTPGSDCDDTDATLSGSWGPGVPSGYACVGPFTPASGACSPYGSTYNYMGTIYDFSCAGGEPRQYQYTQTCQTCATWGSGVSSGTGCMGSFSPASGACSPVGATNNYLSGLFGDDCFGNPQEPEPEYYRYTQTCIDRA
ncbi:hypothetical protein LCGC14_2672030, partial [marine sediment metagenome]